MEKNASRGGPLAALVTASAAELLANIARASRDVWPEARAVAAQAESLRDRATPLAQLSADAYEDALARCGTSWAPWHIVPANAKWYRNYVIARAIVERLEPYERAWQRTLAEVGRQQLQALQQAHIPEREAGPQAKK